MVARHHTSSSSGFKVKFTKRTMLMGIGLCGIIFCVPLMLQPGADPRESTSSGPQHRGAQGTTFSGYLVSFGDLFTADQEFGGNFDDGSGSGVGGEAVESGLITSDTDEARSILREDMEQKKISQQMKSRKSSAKNSGSDDDDDEEDQGIFHPSGKASEDEEENPRPPPPHATVAAVSVYKGAKLEHTAEASSSASTADIARKLGDTKEDERGDGGLREDDEVATDAVSSNDVQDENDKDGNTEKDKHSSGNGKSSKKKTKNGGGSSSNKKKGGSGKKSLKKLKASEIDFTLITQTSMDRMWMLEHISKRWMGPMSAAVFALDRKGEKGALEEAAKMQEQNPLLHIQVKKARDRNKPYPVNELRNIALANVKTSHFFFTDVDLWPDDGLYNRLLGLRASDTDMVQAERNALVVAAFQRNGGHGLCKDRKSCNAVLEYMPTSHSDLAACVMTNDCDVFYPDTPVAHSTTDYTKWWVETDEDPPRELDCFFSNRYEPYLVLRKHARTPTFDEHFTGYGKNKISYIAHLRYAGYRFFVVPRSFVVHMPHPLSESKLSWQNFKVGNIRNSARFKADSIYLAFLSYLRRRYPYQMKVPICE